MAYWLDEGWHSWPEIVTAGTAAAGLYARCGSYIADHVTDGLVPAGVVRMYGTAEWARRLVDAGLWTIEGDGYRDVRYFPLNPSSAEVAKRKAAAAERQRKSRAGKRVTRDSPVTHTNTSRVTDKAPSPLAPPTGGLGGGGGSGRSAGKPHAFNERPDSPNWCVCDMPRANKIHTQGGRAA